MAKPSHQPRYRWNHPERLPGRPRGFKRNQSQIAKRVAATSLALKGAAVVEIDADFIGTVNNMIIGKDINGVAPAVNNNSPNPGLPAGTAVVLKGSLFCGELGVPEKRTQRDLPFGVQLTFTVFTSTTTGSTFVETSRNAFCKLVCCTAGLCCSRIHWKKKRRQLQRNKTAAVKSTRGFVRALLIIR